MSESSLEFNVSGKGAFRRFIVEMEQGIVKLVCDGKSIPYKNIRDISKAKKDALLDAITDIAIDMFDEESITIDKTELIAEIETKAEEFENIGKQIEAEPEEEPVE